MLKSNLVSIVFPPYGFTKFKLNNYFTPFFILSVLLVGFA